MRLLLDDFGGLIPRTTGPKLPDRNAQTARNVRIEGASLRPMRASVVAIAGDPTFQAPYNGSSIARALYADINIALATGSWGSIIKSPRRGEQVNRTISNQVYSTLDYNLIGGSALGMAPTTGGNGRYNPICLTMREWTTGGQTGLIPESFQGEPGAFKRALGCPPPGQPGTDIGFVGSTGAFTSGAPSGRINSAIRGPNPTLVVTNAAKLKTGNRIRISGLPSGNADLAPLNGQSFGISVSSVNTTTGIANVKLESFDASEWAEESYTFSPATWTRDYADSELESRIYVLTNINDLGEESAPSPASAIVDVADGQAVQITLSTQPIVAVNNVNYNIKARRLYRSVAGTSEVTYLLVPYSGIDGDIPIGQAYFVDDSDFSELAEALPTEGHALPPQGLDYFVAMPSGYIVGLKGNEIIPSEWYQPHTFPPRYRKTLTSEIVGAATFGDNLVVATKGKPWIGTGLDPSSLGGREVDIIEGCISPFAVVGCGYGVLFPSANGLIEVTAGGARNVTLPYMTPEQWQQYARNGTGAFNGIPCIAAWWRGRYIIMPPGEATALVVRPMQDGAELTTYEFTHPISALFSDEATSRLFAATSRGNIGIIEVEPVDDPDDAAECKTYTWRSKRFRLPRETTFHWMQVYGRCAGFTLQVTITAFQQGGSGVVSHVNTYTVTDQKPMRLKTGFIGDEYEIQVTGTAEIDHLIVAESIEELQQA